MIPPRRDDLEIYVDASTSWGIGLIVNGRWLAWRLAPGWKSDGRDIGWAEMAAVLLALLYLKADGVRDARVLIHSDNQGVIGALKAGCSRSVQQNRILKTIVSELILDGLWPELEYVNTKDNPADAPSRGALPPASSRLSVDVPIPFELRSLLSVV